MINFDEAFSQLPDLPDFSGRWVPVYLEPMMASGERLTVAVAALGDDGSAMVKMALHQEKIQAMYGDKASSFTNIIETIVSSFQYHLHTKQTFDGWVYPFNGISIGEARNAMSTGIVGILRQAVSMTASLSALEFDDTGTSERDEKNDRWPTQVREEVLNFHPELTDYFRRSFHTSNRSKACRIFFLSPHIAVNTGRLVPGSNISYNFDVNKSRILDLLTVKENEGSMAPRNAHELIVYRPHVDDAAFSSAQMKSLDEYVNALVDAGDRHEIRVTTAHSPQEASQRLCRLEFGR
ncbi:hypothetical protein [Enterobacter sp. R4-368]|uniref:hypothetical protein n=1 Tax=Enterobacter sp. R4-368 TaxID=1166130 RepID=UPI00034F0840|nr:hypothetical protein [Enterobacter sp. R4-368]AGN84916.1 hypothetical protein H650_06765 [Enterobacter sp. R4-368]